MRVLNLQAYLCRSLEYGVETTAKTQSRDDGHCFGLQEGADSMLCELPKVHTIPRVSPLLLNVPRCLVLILPLNPPEGPKLRLALALD